MNMARSIQDAQNEVEKAKDHVSSYNFTNFHIWSLTTSDQPSKQDSREPLKSQVSPNARSVQKQFSSTRQSHARRRFDTRSRCQLSAYFVIFGIKMLISWQLKQCDEQLGQVVDSQKARQKKDARDAVCCARDRKSTRLNSSHWE